LFPQLQIKHTHRGQAGEVYVPFINWLLFIGCVALVIGFGSSAALGSAYGLAVAGNMLMTSIAMMVFARKVWKWSSLCASLVFAPLVLIDAGFIFANSTKVLEGAMSRSA
jgi:KUP system potassium uptake protein